ncbi:MAG: hypothetical protein AWU57_1020 [Marinobacter sp. T13-3]|nr:MAG: hypothetical protein AWU57_1020 [Marinobacter sp. T13-3]
MTNTSIIRRWIMPVATSLMIIASPARAVTKDASDNVQAKAERSAEQWVDRCNADAFATERLGSLALSEAQSGLSILMEAGEAPALDKVSIGEACLSIAASQYAERPVFVVKKGIRHDLGVSEAVIRVSPTIARQQSFAYKLDELQLDVLPDGVFKGKTYLQRKEIDPVAAKSHLHFYLATQIEQQARSGTYNLNYDGTCLIGVADGHVMDAFDKGASQRVSQGLSNGDRQWLRAYGPAQEFWHEAAHCLPGDVMRERAMRPNGKSAIAQNGRGPSPCQAAQQSLKVLDQVSKEEEFNLETALLEAQAGSSAVARVKLVNKQQAQETTDADAEVPVKPQPKASPKMPPLTKESRAIAEASFDDAQIIKLSIESLMDNLALIQVRQRFRDAIEGCNLNTHPTQPWKKLRVLWSIADPNAMYMTWLTPWLLDHPASVQRQMFADAWAGLRNAKKQVSSKAFYQDWLKQAAARNARNSLFRSPNGTPDPGRAERWTQWMLDYTETPTAIQQAALR